MLNEKVDRVSNNTGGTVSRNQKIYIHASSDKLERYVVPPLKTRLWSDSEDLIEPYFPRIGPQCT